MVLYNLFVVPMLVQSFLNVYNIIEVFVRTHVFLISPNSVMSIVLFKDLRGPLKLNLEKISNTFEKIPFFNSPILFNKFLYLYIYTH